MLILEAVQLGGDGNEHQKLVSNGSIMQNKVGMMGSQACEGELLLQAQLLP